MRLFIASLACFVLGCAGPSSPAVSPVAPSSALPAVSGVALSQPRLVQPDSVLAEQFTGQLDRAMRKAFRVPGTTALQSLTGDLVVVPISTRPAGTYIFPAPGGPQVTVPEDVTTASFVINIALADKLAGEYDALHHVINGKTLSARFYFSNDNWQTVIADTGGTWTSYGPDGFFSAFQNQLNPDPSINIVVFSSTKNRRGYLIRGELVLAQPIDVGLTITTQ